jgi:hypothetical protein
MCWGKRKPRKSKQTLTMKKTTQLGIIVVTALTLPLAFVGCSTSAKKTAAKPAFSLMATPTYCGAFNNTSGSIVCVGSYTGYAYITNSATTNIWFTPSSGITNCTITDSSGLSSPYWSVVRASSKDLIFSACGTNTVSFPVSSSKQYRFTIYIKNTPPPPTNGQVLTLDVEWQP